LEGKDALVTGAGGFIGSHLVERLVEMGANVRAFVRYNSRNDRGLLELLPREVLSAIEVVFGDLRDSYAVREVCQGIDVIFHLGALIAIPYSYQRPREVVETNVLGTLNVLMAGRDLGAERVVHTSTSEVYGTAQYTPIDEKHPLQGQSPYSASKIGADRLAESFHRSFNLPVCTIRPFNTYGPRQSARAVIPSIIIQTLTQGEIHLGDLTPRRDFTYVSDTVEGFINMAQAKDRVLGEEINLGANSEVSIGELAQTIFQLVGRSPRIVVEAERLRPEKSEVYRLLADNRKANALIGWSPQVSLTEGLQRTIAWIQNHLDRYRPQEYQV
jgi:NAD dependent epimerase/dehydratase